MFIHPHAMSRLPYQDIRIIEKSTTLTGRLVGLLFADQGADVFIERAAGAPPGDHDGYLDRGKTAVPAGSLADTASADVLIVDGPSTALRQSGETARRRKSSCASRLPFQATKCTGTSPRPAARIS